MGRWRGLVLVAVVATACTGAPQPEREEAASPPSSTETVTADTVVAAPTRTAMTWDGELVEVDARPVDLAAAVDVGVDDGRWSEAQGLTAAVLGFVGVRDTESGLGVEDVKTPGVTNLLHRAQELLDAGGLAANERDELEAAVAHLLPTLDVLDRISRPADDPIVLATAPAVDAPRMVLARAPTTEPESGPGCADVAAQGFSTNTSYGGQCYRHESEFHEGSILNLYYPGHWVDDPGRRTVVRLTGTALRRSITTYREIGLPAGDVHLVFSVHSHPVKEDAEGVVGGFEGRESCPVTIFPAAESTGATSDAAFRQIVAHEVFHCSQHRAFDLRGPLGAADWAKEGSAEYASNLVEPEANAEHRWADDFDGESLFDPLTELEYSTAVFFQWYANVLGVDAVIDLLATVDEGGSLGSISQMPDLFHEFSIAYVAGAIVDTDGRTRWAAPVLTTADRRVAAEATLPFSLDGYVVQRFRVDYAKTRRYVQEHTYDGDPSGARLSVVAAGSASDVTAWTELPPELRSGCDEDSPWMWVATAPTDPLLELTVTEVEQGSCDPCLLGDWQMDLVTFTSYMTGVFDDLGVGDGLELVITGDYYMAFDEDLEVRMVRRDLTVLPFFGGRAAPATTIQGEDTGTYATDGRSLRVFGISGAASASTGGISVGPFASDGPTAGEITYTCDDERLDLVHQPYGSITLYRIDQIPDPEGVEVRTGTPEPAGDPS